MYFSSLRTPDQLLTVFLMSSLLWPQDLDSPGTDDSNSDMSGPCYTLKAYIPDQRVTLPVKALLDTVITTSSDGNSQVFRAELRIVAAGGLTDHDYGRDVVCKVAYGHRQIEVLQKEADLYNTKLRHLQGTVVPLMYGCYIDDTEEGLTGVLVLQDCGDPLEYKLKYYKLELRYVCTLANDLPFTHMTSSADSRQSMRCSLFIRPVCNTMTSTSATSSRQKARMAPHA